MFIDERTDGDLATLRQLARKERNAHQKDRLLAVVHAIDGMETQDIERSLGRSRAFVQRWAYAYRDGGIEALRAKPRGGSRCRVPESAHARLRELIDAGPAAGEGVCTHRGKDVQAMIEREFGIRVSLDTAYRTLHRMGYACLAPRPTHEHRDEAAQAEFREIAPLLSSD